MRSMFYFAAIAAAVTFTGCCGAGKTCKLGSHLGAQNLGAKNVAPAASDCGCDAAPASADSCSACGTDATVSVSAPYACEGGCSSAPMNAAPADSSCGCSSCGSADGYVPMQSAPVQYAPMQSAPVQYAPAQSSGCSTCDGASAPAPAKNSRGLFSRCKEKGEGGLSSSGVGLFMKSKGKACSTDEQQSRLGFGERPRSLKRASSNNFARTAGVATAQCDSCEGSEATYLPTVAQLPEGYDGGGGGRRISTGIIADLRGRHKAKHSGSGAGAYAGPAAYAGGANAGAADCDANAGAGCGAAGCGVGGKPCHNCLLSKAFRGADHPYGGAVPHTNPARGQSGQAPSYAYPYYTTRGPRDFLRDNPPSIGY